MYFLKGVHFEDIFDRIYPNQGPFQNLFTYTYFSDENVPGELSSHSDHYTVKKW